MVRTMSAIKNNSKVISKVVHGVARAENRFIIALEGNKVIALEGNKIISLKEV